MTYRTSTDSLKGLALNYVVARCEGEAVSLKGESLWLASGDRFDPAQNPQQAGVIFQRERIGTTPQDKGGEGSILKGCDRHGHPMRLRVAGDSLLEAGLRAYVKRQKGESVALPASIVAAMGLH